MKLFFTITLNILLLPIIIAQDQEKIDGIYDEVLNNGRAYDDLRYLCKEIGPRFSGTPGAAAAVEYTYRLMKDYEFDTVFLQPVMVPRWVRGKKEIVRITNHKAFGNFELTAISLGNSIGTGPSGVSAEVVEVSGMDEVEELGKKLEGKIVFFNGKMDPMITETFRAYGNAVIQRAYGASEAAKYGAKAVLIRSMSNVIDDVPHTGSLRYKPNIARIPAMAISTEDAEFLSESLKNQNNLSIYMENHCTNEEDVLSYNVIGQLNGTEYPDEYIAVGGHLDSWDVGEGAHDDGSGCIQSIEAVRAIKESGYKPKRNIRAVMWMNEENGLRGGLKYAEEAEKNNEKHIAALESDRGGFTPHGFTMTGDENQIEKVKSWKEYFEKYHLWSWERPGGGADIGPLAKQGTLLIGLLPDAQRYFQYHHTPADVFENVHRRELELGAGALGGLIYLIDSKGLD